MNCMQILIVAHRQWYTGNQLSNLTNTYFMSTTTQQPIAFTRINNDGNGNPRYVCHFLSLLKEEEKAGNWDVDISQKYSHALKRAKSIGGRKFHNKQYGGGIVFQSYNIKETEQQIKDLLK